MAGSPDWKVYSAANEYLAACKHPEDAACLASFNGDGTTIRWGHSKRFTLWTEGKEQIPASESYDIVCDTMLGRLSVLQRESYKKAYGCYPEEKRTA